MAAISSNIARCLQMLPPGVELVAVSKFHPAEAVAEAYAAGQRRFGESRADELAAKAQALPADIEWHFIGHLQTNKVRRVVDHASVIESIDSERLLRMVSDKAAAAGRRIGVFLQVRVAAEDTKTGLEPDELLAVAARCASLPAVSILGVMGMATNTDDPGRIEADFRAIADCGRSLRRIIPSATALSMGMSDDWPVAVRCGATHVRIGTAIFGIRS